MQYNAKDWTEYCALAGCKMNTWPALYQEDAAILNRRKFELSARHTWPEIDLARDGDSYRSSYTRLLWEGFQMGVDQ